MLGNQRTECKALCLQRMKLKGTVPTRKINGPQRDVHSSDLVPSAVLL